jgi:predicted CoA-substrate-specific enzyme activase
MRSSGFDIGARTVKLAVLEDGELVLSRKSVVSYDPLETAARLIQDIDLGAVAATGYGRHLMKTSLGCTVISEIKAFALGARMFFEDCRTILDIGGQDTKAIALDENGNMSRFEMNDKCAAGTGRFLEIMAAALGYSLEDFSKAALSAKRAEKINSTCTVFAESEVISLTHQGALREEVALGIHKAIISRSTTILKRVAMPGSIFFAGGVAFNECVQTLLGDEMGRRQVFVPPDPQIVGAVGAAIYVAAQGSGKGAGGGTNRKPRD